MKGKWSEQNDKQLINSIKSGIEAKVIAQQTGRTVKAIWQRLSRLGISITESQCYTTRTCKNCGKEDRIVKNKAERSPFCGHSCSASFNNRLREKKIKYCLLCNSKITSSENKYCSHNCSTQHRKQSLIQRWLDGEYKLAIGANGNVTGSIRNYLIEQANNRCSRCGWCEVNHVTGKVPLTVDHVDGNLNNADPKNLKVLCPNCHSLTSTYGSLNKGRGRKSNGFKRT